MTITEIINEVISEVGEDTADTALVTKMLGFTKAALRRFPRFMRNRMVTAKKSGTLAAAATTMSLPSGVVTVQKAYYESSGERVEIERIKLDRFTEQYRGDATGKPQYFIIRGNTVEFDRKNDASRTIYFESMVEIDDVEAADTWAYSSDRAEILKDGIKSYYFASIEDETWHATNTNLFAAGLKELEREYTREEMADHVEEA